MRWPIRPARLAACLLAVIGLPATPALASGTAATATGSALAQVVEPLVVARQADLAFGGVFASKLPGTVSVGADGALGYSGGAQSACMGGACLDTHPASFTVTGEPGRTYVVQLPASVVATGSITGGGGGLAPPLDVDGLAAVSANAASGGTAWQLDGQGRDRFDIGGTLHLPADLPSANYQVTIPVVVVYG
ncbi:MAG: DUF4402 domain-containing protein [Sphingomonadales bacterium]|nr:DUF4402 domain-containing protein [Sphingomonadales bacterium]MDE2568436.1 DUF4402 domain-containing protein [Sphingomonadales bacterium]